jgi:hypothetical protein
MISHQLSNAPCFSGHVTLQWTGGHDGTTDAVAAPRLIQVSAALPLRGCGRTAAEDVRGVPGGRVGGGATTAPVVPISHRSRFRSRPAQRSDQGHPMQPQRTKDNPT